MQVEDGGKDSHLRGCGCFDYIRDKDEIEIVVSEDWPANVQSDSLIILLSFEGVQKVYILPLQISF